MKTLASLRVPTLFLAAVALTSLAAVGCATTDQRYGFRPLGPVTLSGPINITYFGRSTLTALGTFTSQITFLNFTGTFNGHTIEAMLNPASPSLGMTSVNEVPGGQFRVDSFFDVFAELSIDGGPMLEVAAMTSVPGAAMLRAHAAIVSVMRAVVFGLMSLIFMAWWFPRALSMSSDDQPRSPRVASQ